MTVRRTTSLVQRFVALAALVAPALFVISASTPAAAAEPTLYRVDTGPSPAVGWTSDAAFVSGGNLSTTTASIDMSDPSVPAGTPMKVFQSERSYNKWNAPVQYSFPVTPGEYEVRVYMAETWSPLFAVGKRVFDVLVEGQVVFDDVDIFAEVGAAAGLVKSHTLEVSDSTLNVSFAHVVQNPSVRGIEIIPAGPPVGEPGVLGVSSSSLDLGSVVEGGSASGSVTLTNLGAVGDPDITVSGVALSGANVGEFSHDVVVPVLLSPGEDLVVSVTFVAGAPGVKSASLDVTHSGSGSPVSVALSAESEPDGSQPGVLGVSSSSLDLGSVVEGGTASGSVTLTNLGGVGDPDITVSGVALSGANADEFSHDVVVPVVLSPGEELVVSVTFIAGVQGAKSASLNVTHSGSPGLSVSVVLIAQSSAALVGPLYRVDTGPSPAEGWTSDAGFVSGGNLSTTTASIDMSDPSVPAGTPMKVFQSGRSYNPWNAPMQYAFAVTPGEYEVRVYMAETWSPAFDNGKRVFDVLVEGGVVFDDVDIFAEVGANAGLVKSHTLEVSDGTLNVSFAHVVQNPNIRGIEIIKVDVQPGVLGVSPSSLDLGSVVEGGTASGSVTLTNLGGVGDPDITVSGIGLSGANAGEFSHGVAVPAVVAPGEDLVVSVTFVAGAPGVKSASLDVAHSGSGSPVSVALSAESEPDGSQPGVLGVSSSSLDLGSVVEGGTASGSVTLTNLGGVGDPDITVSGVALSGANAGEFSHGVVVPVVLSPGEELVVPVTFTAGVQGAKSASLNVTHSGSGSPLSVALSGESVDDIAIGFGKVTLSGASLSKPTSLQFGPDGRLYVAQQNGLIKAFTVVRTGANNYSVSSTETITTVQAIPNHDDDGTPNPSITDRLVTGLTVTGTSATPVLYVTSSDPRIGAGPSGTDLNLDTNSGVVSRLTRNGSGWTHLQLVRGLPRSEENHTANGLVLDQATNTLYIAHGGNTNHGAPSNNFALLPEYALSAAILSVDLDAIGNATYDLPTLDDEDRPGSNDANDPFGGNDGKNQARLVAGGPVQVYAPGFRNPYDVILTADGRMYTVDNGGNSSWGGAPSNEGPGGVCTNAVNNGGPTFGDSLHLITGAGYYGGHPNPTRGNMANTFNTTNPQSPVGSANPVECDFRSMSERGVLHVFPSSTNGLVEYTASNFGGSMSGDLLSVGFDKSVYRVQINPATGGLAAPVEALFPSAALVPLDVTAQGDSGVFPGTVWVADHVGSQIVVFEPNDYGNPGGPTCTGAYDTGLDEDNDGFSNADEIDNGTNPCSAGSQPPDWDGDGLSDLNDPDDDNDGLDDLIDPFALDPLNGRGTALPVLYTWENDAAPAGGFFNLGFTGLMNNGVDDYLTQFDAGKMTAGGAAGVSTIDEISEGTATGADNDQEYGFQFGVDASTATPFTVRTRVVGPFATLVPQNGQSMGLSFGDGTQSNYMKVVVAGDGGGAVQAAIEVDDVTTIISSVPVSLPGPDAIDLVLAIDPTTATATARFAIDDGSGFGPLTDVGSAFPFPLGWLTQSTAPAVGIIGTSAGPAPAFPATWDFMEVVPVVSAGSGSARIAVTPSGNINASTYGTGSFSIQNTSPAGKLIDRVVIDIGNSLVDDVVFDPDGTAGDPVGRDFTADSGAAATGLVGRTFSVPNGGGYEVLTIDFDDFDPGETLTFSIDIDPTSIKGAAQPGPSDSGSVSGLELSGSAVTLHLADGSVTSGSIAPGLSGSGGGFAIVDAANTTAPQLALVGVASDTTVTSASQTLRISGEPGQVVSVLRAEAGLFLDGVPNGGYDVDPYEVNSVTALQRTTVTVGAGGTVDVPVTLTNSGPDQGYNLFIASYPQSTDPGLASNRVKVLYETAGSGGEPGVLGVSSSSLNLGSVVEGGTASGSVTLTNLGGGGDPDITVSGVAISGADAGEFSHDVAVPVVVSPGEELVVSVTFVAGAPGAKSASLGVTHSGAGPPVSVTLSAQSSTASVGPLYRVDTGPSPAAGWTSDAGFVSGGNLAITTASINLSHPSVPAGTPMKVFQSERSYNKWNAPVQYAFPVTPGEYEVRVYMAETWSPVFAVGKRVFDVLVEGGVVFDDVDIFAEVGANAGLVKSHTLEVSDGTLNVSFAHVVQNPSVRGIEIIQVG